MLHTVPSKVSKALKSKLLKFVNYLMLTQLYTMNWMYLLWLQIHFIGLFWIQTVVQIRLIWVTEPTSHRGATTIAPWQRIHVIPVGTLTVPPPQNAGTTQRTVSASGRRLPAATVIKILYVMSVKHFIKWYRYLTKRYALLAFVVGFVCKCFEPRYLRNKHHWTRSYTDTTLILFANMPLFP